MCRAEILCTVWDLQYEEWKIIKLAVRFCEQATHTHIRSLQRLANILAYEHGASRSAAICYTADIM